MPVRVWQRQCTASVDPCDLRLGEAQVDGPEAVNHLLLCSGAGDDRGHPGLREQVRETHLCHTRAVSGPPIAPTNLPTPSGTLTYVPDGSSPQPASGQYVLFDPVRGGAFQWCVHNNSLDPAFTWYKGVSLPVNCQTPNQCDLDGILTIESYGYGPNGATAHLSVDISYYNPPSGRNQDHITAGVDARNSGGGSWLPPTTGQGAPAWQTVSF